MSEISFSHGCGLLKYRSILNKTIKQLYSLEV